MATVREGSRMALLVVDVQQGVVAQAWEAAQVVGRVAQAVARARAAGTPVIWIQHEDEELVRGSEAWQWAPGLAPVAGEHVIAKYFNSGFEDTPLESVLAGAGISHLVLAGAATNWCIRATAYAALERGYDLTLLQDAHTTSSLELGGGERVEASDLVRDLNTAMRWLSYPGRRNAVAGAADFAFAAAGVAAA